MSIDQLQNAVRAGYTSNDPIGNLGLFGMGFNIATARLGEETTILSTRSGDADWVGVKIDFQKLIDSKKFDAPIIRKVKSNPEESGTRITIAKLKTGILGELSNKESEIRQRLELIYTQYPVELGTSIGGRIVGELHVDYLIPTYQKNDFDRADVSWEQTREAICGMGPFLPKSRKAMGFHEDNTSPLCLLVNAYRRVDKGTKCLFAPNDLAKRYAAEFKRGARDYLDDTKWWKAAQERVRRIIDKIAVNTISVKVTGFSLTVLLDFAFC